MIHFFWNRHDSGRQVRSTDPPLSANSPHEPKWPASVKISGSAFFLSYASSCHKSTEFTYRTQLHRMEARCENDDLSLLHGEFLVVDPFVMEASRRVGARHSPREDTHSRVRPR